jgi:hypothetical protein
MVGERGEKTRFRDGLVALTYSCGKMTQLEVARLVAAAPELLTALRLLLQEIDEARRGGGIDGDAFQHQCVIAYAAIAKATEAEAIESKSVAEVRP